MVDVGPAVLAELDLERDLPLAEVAQSPDVLSDEAFVRRDRVGTAIDGDALLEVEMDRMVPTAAAVDVGPVLDLARFRDQERDPVGVHRVRGLAVDPDGPREHRGLRAVGRALTCYWVARVALAGPSELHDPGPHRRDDRDLLRQDRRHHARVWVSRPQDAARDLPR